jgi:Rad51
MRYSVLHCLVGLEEGRVRGRDVGKIDFRVMTAMTLINPTLSPPLHVYHTPYTHSTITPYSQMQLGQFLRQLTRLTEEFGIAVVLTNQVVADPGGTFTVSTHDVLIG